VTTNQADIGPSASGGAAGAGSGVDHRVDDARVARFGRNERVAHWWTVAMVATALITGLDMGSEAESGTVMNVHIASVVLMGAGIILAFIVGDTRRMMSSIRQLFVFDRLDAHGIASIARHPLSRQRHIAWGKFNVGQKCAAWAVSASFTVLIWTGVRSWQTGGDAAGPHNAAAFITLALLCGHVVMAVVNPSTRPALPGMVFGHVRRSWAATHHRAWLDRLDRSETQ